MTEIAEEFYFKIVRNHQKTEDKLVEFQEFFQKMLDIKKDKSYFFNIKKKI
jgi:hypothetical protein